MGKKVFAVIAAIGIFFIIGACFYFFVIHPFDKSAADGVVSALDAIKVQDQSKVSITDPDILQAVKNEIAIERFAESNYTDPCDIQVDENKLYTALLTNGTQESWPLTAETWANYLPAKAHCKAVEVNGKKYLAIYGNETNQYIEVFSYI